MGSGLQDEAGLTESFCNFLNQHLAGYYILSKLGVPNIFVSTDKSHCKFRADDDR